MYPEKPSVLPYEDIPFMHLGIINRHNFNWDMLPFVPKKRWDPLTTKLIPLKSKGQKARTNFKYVGHFSYISPIRGLRPKPKERKPGEVVNIFKPIIAGEDYAIFITLDEERYENSFSTRPSLKKVSERKAVTIINRFPSMVRMLEEDLVSEIRAKVEDDYTKIAFGINLVTLPVRYFESISDARIEDLY